MTDKVVKPKPFWEDQWPSRIDSQGRDIPRIWKRPDKPDPDRDYIIRRSADLYAGQPPGDVNLVDESGNWRWPWYYRVPGWCACYTDTFEHALAIVNTWWQEDWLMKRFPDAGIGHSHVGYPWADRPPAGGYKPPGVYCNA